MFQLIDSDKNFTKEINLYIKDKWKLFDLNLNYNLIAVFGSQSTGKS